MEKRVQLSRSISEKFMQDLQEGILQPLLERVKKDYTLMLAIRNGYINVYYRGGCLITLSESKSYGYRISFDEKYLNDEQGRLKQFIQGLPRIQNAEDIAQWVHRFPEIKQAIDFKLSSKGSDEREFQQLIFRENNFSRLSNDTEYFFSDIEYSPHGLPPGVKQFRFDMLGIEWLASKRKNGASCRPVIMEIKYGDNAFSGASGIKSHLDDIKSFLKIRNAEFIAQINSQIAQLRELGLIKFKKNRHPVEIQAGAKPIVVFVFANTNPRGNKLKNLIKNELAQIDEQDFDVRFFVSNFCGYAMHEMSMLTIQEFTQLAGIIESEA